MILTICNIAVFHELALDFGHTINKKTFYIYTLLETLLPCFYYSSYQFTQSERVYSEQIFKK